jgi:hypothetical protein
MFLGGLALATYGAVDLQKAADLERYFWSWRQDTIRKSAILCDSDYNEIIFILTPFSYSIGKREDSFVHQDPPTNPLPIFFK